MLKDVISKLDYSNYDEIALVIFGLCFLAICLGAFWLRKDAAHRFGLMPLDDMVPMSHSIAHSETSGTPKNFQNDNDGDRQ